jgi:hypothetical protein
VNDRVPIQVGVELGRDGRSTVPEPIARMAYAEYERQGHGSQSFDRLHERGGFGVVELMTLLCQRIAFIEARTKGIPYAECKRIARSWPKEPT